MSTDFRDEEFASPEWISQSEAARIQGVSRQAIHKLVRSGRLTSRVFGGHVFVRRQDVETFDPQSAGRPPRGDRRAFDRLMRILDACDAETQDQVFRELQRRKPLHPIEQRLGTTADVILAALGRASELTVRMFRGVIAEAAFETHVVSSLVGWRSEEVPANSSCDFLLVDAAGSLRVQIKLQRSERGQYLKAGDYYIVETQRTRGGTNRSTQQSTRPYHFGEFDLLAVCLQPCSGRWERFIYTPARWLQPTAPDSDAIATFQPVAAEPNDDWTDDFPTVVSWVRSDRKKSIRGDLRALRRKPRGPSSTTDADRTEEG